MCPFVLIVQENKNLKRHGRNNIFWLQSQLKANIYDFRIAMMFGSSLLSFVCNRAHVFFFLRYLCLRAHSDVQHLLCCGFFVLVLCLVYAVSLDCPFVIDHSVFSYVYIRLQHDRVHGQCPGSNDYRSVNRR